MFVCFDFLCCSTLLSTSVAKRQGRKCNLLVLFTNVTAVLLIGLVILPQVLCDLLLGFKCHWPYRSWGSEEAITFDSWLAGGLVKSD